MLAPAAPRPPKGRGCPPLAPLAASSTLSYNSIYLQSNNNEIALQGHPYKINSAEISCTSDLLFAFNGGCKVYAHRRGLRLRAGSAAAARARESGAGPGAEPRAPRTPPHPPEGRLPRRPRTAGAEADGTRSHERARTRTRTAPAAGRGHRRAAPRPERPPRCGPAVRPKSPKPRRNA